jgi:hypothetical protein
VNPRLTLSGETADQYVGHALSLYRKFEESGRSRQTFRIDNAIILLRKDDIKIISSPIAGFITYPRSGPIVFKTVQVGDSLVPLNYLMVDGPGFDSDNKPFDLRSLSSFPYPENQLMPNGNKGPWGAKSFTKDKDDTDWAYDPGTGPFYGNIDWKGPPDDDRLVITWVGAASRYFNQVPIMCQLMGFPAFDNRVFSGGEVMATLPNAVIFPVEGFSYSPQTTDMGEAIPYVVLGAAVTIDAKKNQWLVVVCRWFATDISGHYYNRFNILALPMGSASTVFYDPKDHPDGWRVLYDTNDYTMAHTLVFLAAWFFNESGTEGCTVSNGVLYKTVIDIDHMKATVTIDASFSSGVQRGSGTLEQTSSGDPVTIETTGGEFDSDSFDTSNINEDATLLIAADYKGDELQTALVKFNSTTDGSCDGKETIVKENIDVPCELKTGYRRTTTQRNDFEGSGSYDWNLLLTSGEQISLGPGSMEQKLIWDYSKLAASIMTRADAITPLISGPVAPIVGSIYTAAGGLVAPFHFSMSNGSIDSATGIITSLDTVCGSGSVYGLVSVTDACGRSASMQIYLNPVAAIWTRVACTAFGVFADQCAADGITGNFLYGNFYCCNNPSFSPTIVPWALTAYFIYSPDGSTLEIDAVDTMGNIVATYLYQKVCP